MDFKVFQMTVGPGGRVFLTKLAEFATDKDARTFAYAQAYKLNTNILYLTPRFDPQIFAPFGD